MPAFTHVAKTFLAHAALRAHKGGACPPSTRRCHVLLKGTVANMAGEAATNSDLQFCAANLFFADVTHVPSCAKTQKNPLVGTQPDDKSVKNAQKILSQTFVAKAWRWGEDGRRTNGTRNRWRADQSQKKKRRHGPSAVPCSQPRCKGGTGFGGKNGRVEKRTGFQNTSQKRQH
jgi:hypothetical protein